MRFIIRMLPRVSFAYVVAYLAVMIFMAGTAGSNPLTWAPDNYLTPPGFREQLPMWAGLALGFALSIGRVERKD